MHLAPNIKATQSYGERLNNICTGKIYFYETFLSLPLSSHDSLENKLKNSFCSLACRCAVEAKKLKYAYFGIRYYGECYGGTAATIDDNHRSNDCFSNTYGECNDTDVSECGGKGETDYVFKLISEQENSESDHD